MSISIGTQLGSHEITALLGKGGMGEVYRARDSKLKREVAIKILPEEFSRNADRVSRFQREAEMLASLNHPNIGGIYDLQESNGSNYLVLELVEGETLQDRIQRGPIPVAEALSIAKQICEALEAAHERGIIHRDLKPANIKLTPDGRVKVLDFGLAKAFQEQSPVALSNSPTMMSASMPGAIVGTAAYMAPEQARGKNVDRRADVWAFGCVLYEMLTGKPAFDGDSITDILARIIEREPNFGLLDAVPARIRNICRRCLDKDIRRRFQDIGDVRYELEANDQPLEPAKRSSRFTAVIAAVLGLVAIGLAIPAAMYLRGTRVDSSEVRLDITTPATTDPVSLAISPDLRKVVFVALQDNKSRLWLRSMDSTSAQPIAATDGATFPFWSPDSQNIGFFADGKLKRIDVLGGAPQILANATTGRGGSWGKDDVILFAPVGAGGIYRVSATGGDVKALTQPEGAKHNNHRSPQILPDGRHFIFYAQGSLEGHGEYLGSLDSPEIHKLLDADASVVLVPPDAVAFIRGGTLFAQRFDGAKNVLVGEPFAIAQSVAFDYALTIAALSAGPGAIAYRTGAALNTGQLEWFDRRGQNLGKLGDADFHGYNPDLSPDGKRVALDTGTIGGGVGGTIWLMEAGRGVNTRLTLDASTNVSATWSPQGDRIVFASNRKGIYDLYLKTAGGGPDELLFESGQIKWPESWSADGRYIIYREQHPKSNFDLWALSLEDHKTIPIANTDFEEREGQFSPDGRWVAYQSNESGRPEIYVQPFPNPTGKWRVSTSGGSQVRWRRDGKELFYISLDEKLTTVPISTAANGNAIDIGTASALFAVHLNLGPVSAIQRQQYVVSADGQRFLVNSPIENQVTNPITMILNWRPKR
jgi:serine/threonine protein kinase